MASQHRHPTVYRASYQTWLNRGGTIPILLRFKLPAENEPYHTNGNVDRRDGGLCFVFPRTQMEGLRPTLPWMPRAVLGDQQAHVQRSRLAMASYPEFLPAKRLPSLRARRRRLIDPSKVAVACGQGGQQPTRHPSRLYGPQRGLGLLRPRVAVAFAKS